ncbi:striatin-4 isoform 1-T1 [Ara ararauna]
MAAERAARAAAARPGPGAGLNLPGVLHFIQHEWARFEAEKGRWEAERAELRAQVAFLQGERKGQENLKSDLVRRIKMLEYALKQERSKYHKLKFGTDSVQGERKEGAEPVANGPMEVASLESGPLAWKEGRQLLRQYLEEVGYSDTILDMRSRRVRSLLARGPPIPVSPPKSGSPPPGAGSPLLRRIQEQIQRNAGKEADEEQGPFPPGEEEDSDEEEDGDGLQPPPGQPQHKKQRVKLPPSPVLPEVDDDDDDDDSEDALNEFDFLGSGDSGGRGDPMELERRRGRWAELRDVDGLLPKVPPGPARAPEGPPAGPLGITSDVFILDPIGAVPLGDLADLTVTNDSDLGCDVPDAGGGLRKCWSPRFTLRSHLDAVRALAFHPVAPALLTASEDGTVKLWNLQRPPSPKRTATVDVEPVYAFRGHRGPVLAVAMGCDSALCCSGGLDARIHCWRLPELDRDPYDGYDPAVLGRVLEGHRDAVWALAFNGAGDRVASCSADGTVRIWDPRRGGALVTYEPQSDHGVPTSITFSATQPGQAVVAFRTGTTVLYDVEVARPILALDPRPGGGGCQVNQVVSHPSQPLAITASEDRSIRFLDHRTGKVVHSMVAHLDAVTCLALDPNGVFLMSGSHDCSLRLWHVAHRTCVQELSAHRRKHDEAVHAVAFHPRRSLSASAGADAVAKVFV